MPPDEAEQQPPLHVCVELQAVVHVCVVVLHAVFAGQSAVPLQPHEPLPRHRWPLPLVVHTAQVPDKPQSPAAVPGWQVPPVVAEQHPPLHDCVELQEVVHLPCVVSHASPVGQSLACWQPHTLVDRHTWPF